MSTWNQFIGAALCVIVSGGATLANDLNATAVAWVEKEVAASITASAEVKAAVEKANEDRAKWAPFTADWENWNPEAAEKNKDSYGYAEWAYSVKKDKAMREALISGPAADFARKLVSDTGGKVTRVMLLDRNGGNVAADVATTDYFQGDEPKWSEAIKSKKPAAGEPPYKDKRTGENVAGVLVPLLDAKGEVIGGMYLLVSTDKLK